jgi:long-chain fatty acid transport protein
MGRFEKYSGLFADAGAFDIPESYGLGVAVRPSKAWTIGLDWQRILYADVQQSRFFVQRRPAGCL